MTQKFLVALKIYTHSKLLAAAGKLSRVVQWFGTKWLVEMTNSAQALLILAG